MHPILFKIGSLTIYTYGVFVVAGILAAYFTATAEAVRRGVDKKIFSDFVFWVIVWGFAGARILYILVEFPAFLDAPLSMIFNRAGFVFFGGVLFGISAAYILSRRHGLDFRTIADSMALGVPVGHALGRMGCFCYGCCYGLPTASRIGMTFPASSPAGMAGGPVIPTQLISSGSLFLIFVALLILRRRTGKKGMIAVAYVLFYGVFRFCIEFFRGDPRGFIGMFSVSQWISLGMIVAGIAAFPVLHKKGTREKVS